MLSTLEIHRAGVRVAAMHTQGRGGSPAWRRCLPHPSLLAPSTRVHPADSTLSPPLLGKPDSRARLRKPAFGKCAPHRGGRYKEKVNSRD